jgi:hypothetical protein
VDRHSPMSRLATRLLPVALTAALLTACSDPYQHGAGGNTSVVSTSTATTATTTPGASTLTTQNPGQSTQTTVPTSSADIEAAGRAAQAFLGAYVPYTYGQVRARQIPAADPALIAQLAASPPSVPPAVRARHPEVMSLSVSAQQAAQIGFEADVSDGTDTYAIPLTVTHEHNQWLVTSVQ